MEDAYEGEINKLQKVRQGENIDAVEVFITVEWYPIQFLDYIMEEISSRL